MDVGYSRRLTLKLFRSIGSSISPFHDGRRDAASTCLRLESGAQETPVSMDWGLIFFFYYTGFR